MLLHTNDSPVTLDQMIIRSLYVFCIYDCCGMLHQQQAIFQCDIIC